MLAMHRCQDQEGRVAKGRPPGSVNDVSHGVRIILRAAHLPCLARQEVQRSPSAPADLLSVRCWTAKCGNL